MEMAATVYYTADMARALPDDGNRYEVVYGELLVTPAPRVWHEVIQKRLADALTRYVDNEPVGFVMGSRSDISWATDVLLSPDVFVAPVAQVATLDWSKVRDLLLVAEVLSPSSVRFDRFAKRRRYQEAGVPVYWIVDGDAKQAEIWTPRDSFPQVETERLLWHPDGAATRFELDLETLFRPL